MAKKLIKYIREKIKLSEGITLTESVIYISIISVVTVVLISIIVQIVQIKTRANSMSIISSEVSNFFDRLIYDVRNADSFTVVDSQTLQVESDSIISTFSLQDSKIILNKESTDYIIVTDQVSVDSIEFADWTSVNSDNLLHIHITLSRGGLDETFQTTVHKR